MSNDTCILVTLSNGEYLLKIALKINSGMVGGDVLEYPLEPENKKQIEALLPMHARSFGTIVEVETIFEVKDYTLVA